MRRSPKRKSVMVHDFSRIPAANIPRSRFSLSAGYKTVFNAGYLVPIFVQEVVPGDTHSVTMQAFARLATPIHPIYDNINLDTFFFFVPNRLVWNNWEKFMGEQDNPGDSVDYTIPTINNFQVQENSIYDFMGIPTAPTGMTVNALPLRMYNLIYNDWFRSEDLQDSRPVNNSQSSDSGADYVLMRRGKRHDYFTSCLPWPQKDFGEPVLLPLGNTAPVITGTTDLTGAAEPMKFGSSASGTPSVDGRQLGIASEGHAATYSGPLSSGDKVYPLNLQADLSQATASTINDLRQAFQIQKLQERDARGGTRYQEIVLAHFGVRGGDARLQRPEYLGGSTHPVGITQVPQTAETAATPQGNLAAYGVGGGRSGFTKSFTEHGYIIGIINARADITYQRGLDRHWSRQTKHDFYFPALARLGEQAVLNKEIYWQGDQNDDLVFGYQERWAEMRHNNSKITGTFRSTATASLDAWHLSQDFASLPTLSSAFIEDTPPMDRIKAVTSEPDFLLDAYFQHTAARPMPIDGSPGYIDHF